MLYALVAFSLDFTDNGRRFFSFCRNDGIRSLSQLLNVIDNFCKNTRRHKLRHKYTHQQYAQELLPFKSSVAHSLPPTLFFLCLRAFALILIYVYMSVDRLLGTYFLKKVFDSPDFLTISKIVRVLYGRRYVEYIKSYEFERTE